MNRNNFKILFIWPFEKQWYEKEVHYHFTDFGSVYNYFKKNQQFELKLLDGAIGNSIKGDFIRTISNEIDLCVVFSKTHNINEACEIANLCKIISPSTKTIVYGPACYYASLHFLDNQFDACVINGDWEIGIQDYIDFLLGKKKITQLSGLLVKTNGRLIKSSLKKYLVSSEWSFPPLEELPLKDLFKTQKACELSVTVIRGCSFNCTFCYVHLKGYDRRCDIIKTVNYIAEVQYKFKSLHFYGANFAYNKDWLIKFCQTLRKARIYLPWRCVSRVHLLNEDVIKRISSEGCNGIGIGVETFSPKLQKFLNKNVKLSKVIEISKIAKKYDLTLKAFIMIGIPGQTKYDIYETISLLHEYGIQIRPTTYVPYQQLMERNNYKQSWHRHTFIDHASITTGLSKGEIFKILYLREKEFKRIYEEFKRGKLDAPTKNK